MLVPCRNHSTASLLTKILGLEERLAKRLLSLDWRHFRTLLDGKLRSSRRYRQFACHRRGRKLVTNPYRSSLCVSVIVQRGRGLVVVEMLEKGSFEMKSGRSVLKKFSKQV